MDYRGTLDRRIGVGNTAILIDKFVDRLRALRIRHRRHKDKADKNTFCESIHCVSGRIFHPVSPRWRVLQHTTREILLQYNDLWSELVPATTGSLCRKIRTFTGAYSSVKLRVPLKKHEKKRNDLAVPPFFTDFRTPLRCLTCVYNE